MPDSEIPTPSPVVDENGMPTAAAMVAANATPATVDADALLATIQRMQEQLDKLQAQTGIPADEVEATAKALSDHVKARVDSVPTVDLSVLTDTVKGLPASKDLTPAHTESVLHKITRVVSRHPHLELHYIRDLAEDLHTLVLDRSVG